MESLYPEHIIDHGMNPRNRGLLVPADAVSEGNFPLCGDTLLLTLRLDEHRRIAAVGWGGDGCAISQASASMLGEAILGKTVEEVRVISKEHIFEWLGIPLSQNRVKCALLSLQVLTDALFGQDAAHRLMLDDD